MANFDILADTLPKNANRPAIGPTLAALRTALTTFSATSYPTSRLDSMSKVDMIYAAKTHGLTVAGMA